MGQAPAVVSIYGVQIVLLFPLFVCGVTKQADLLAVMLVGPIKIHVHVGSGTWIEGQ